MVELKPILMTVLMFAGLFIGLFLGHPLAFVLGGLAVIFGLFSWGPACFPLFVNRILGLTDNFILVAIPMFILMANLLMYSGVADDLFDSLRYLMGPLKGGIALAVVIVCTVFAACTGVIGASVVSMGLLALPMMIRYGYDKKLTAGTIMAGGTLGILIPPSIMLIVMGDQSGLSVGKLYIGSVVPGLVLSALFMLYIAIRCAMRPGLGPPLSLEERQQVSMKKKLMMASVSLVPPVLLIIGVLGAIFSGFATATEAAGVGAFLALLMTMGYRRFSWKMVKETTVSTAKTVSMVMIVLVGATCFTGVFMGMGGGKTLTSLLLGLGLGKWGTFVLMNFIVFILGSLIDWIGIVYITFPIFLPIAVELGFDPVWFVVILAVNLQTSFLTPPFGYALFYMKGIASKELTTAGIYQSVVPFLILQLIGVAICVLFPDMILVPASWIK
ncbi:MAG TPA: TRAP transporter large permease subunit [Thermodesulfobacteriota bacterium]|nr:TRAP transporter large permease subunit [Thermodesulfobacteriota bacterium]